LVKGGNDGGGEEISSKNKEEGKRRHLKIERVKK